MQNEKCYGICPKIPRSNIRKQPWFEYQSSVKKEKHAIVVGAGLAGITSAWALALRGWRIDLLDQRPEIAREGSGNVLGILMPRISLGESAEASFYKAAYLKALRECNVLKKKYPNLIWRQDGVLQIATSERIKKQMKQLDCSSDFARVLSPEESNAQAGVAINRASFYFPLAGCLSPRMLCKSLIDDVAGQIKVHLNTTVQHLSQEDGTWSLGNQDGVCILKSETVILANAAQAGIFEQTRWVKLDVARGQITMATATPKSKKIRCAICFEGYLLPEINGQHLVGASFIRGDHTTEVREEENLENMKRLMRLFPDCLDFKIENLKGHAALRATTPDRMPLLGPVADLDFFKTHYHDLHHGKVDRSYPRARHLKGLYLNTGHGSRGLCSSFLSAEVLAAQICNEALPVSEAIREALDPSRFLIRDLKSGKYREG